MRRLLLVLVACSSSHVDRRSAAPCECHLEREQVQLRGNELVAGKEHATRVP